MNMEPATLRELICGNDEIHLTPKGIRLLIHRAWVVPSEDRLSYASAIRLAECCREHHWNQDIAILAPHIDSVVTRCEAIFRTPLVVGTQIEITYAITRVGCRSYDCQFSFHISGQTDNPPLAVVTLTNVFYVPETQAAKEPPYEVHATLIRLLNGVASS